MSYFPSFSHIEADMAKVTEDDVDLLANQAGLDEGEEVTELRLGSTLEDLTEPARAYVLFASYARYIQEVISGERSIPPEFTREEWGHIIDARAGIARWFYDLTVRHLAQAKGVTIPPKKMVCIAYIEGEFRLTLTPFDEKTLLSDLQSEEEEEGIENSRFGPN